MDDLDARLEGWLSAPHGTLRRVRLALALSCMYVLFSVTYLAINLFSVGRVAHTLYLPGEDRIPFLPVFEYLYALTFFIPVLLVITVREYARLRRLVCAFAVSLLVAYTTYLLFPVFMERPRLEVSSVHTWLLSLQYLDKPYNAFPSMHVTLSWLTAYASQGTRATRVLVAGVAIGVSVSTLFVKQHYVADVLFGFALASVAWKLAPFIVQCTSTRRSSPNGATATMPAE